MKNRNWQRIYWISFCVLLPIVLIIPSDWPELIQWAPVMAIWYIAGRSAQQHHDKRRRAITQRVSRQPIGHVQCYCGDKLPIYGDFELEGEPGEQTATVSADTSALWLHSFTKHPDAHKEGN